MNQKINHNNPLLNTFNNYTTKNPGMVPFQNNNLINNNVHVLNNLNDMTKRARNGEVMNEQYSNKNNISAADDVFTLTSIQKQNSSNNTNNLKRSGDDPKNFNNSKRSSDDIIENLLKPQFTKKNGNRDVKSSFETKIIENKKKIDCLNKPYKIIIKDKQIIKPVEEIKKSDFLVHKSTENDKNRIIFNKELETKTVEHNNTNYELKLEYNFDNLLKHKKKFETEHCFIRNLAYKNNTFDETKDDYIEFYKKHQREAEEGKELCDKVLHSMVDTGLIRAEELPSGCEIISDDIQNE